MFKVFPAQLDCLHEMLAFIAEQFRAFEFKEEAIEKVELACEEALVNIVQYGYLQVKGEISIECLFLDDQGIKIIIRDKGIPFNPLLSTKSFAEKPKVPSEGGYGIYLILNLMDKVTYVRENNCNKLTLIKYKTAMTPS